VSTPSLRSPGALAWGAVFLAVLAWSAIGPKDRPTWWLEVAPALGFFAVLAATRARFPLTPLLYVLVLLHSIILIVGGHYTYARVPIGDWLRDGFNFERNHYDRLGHLLQGFVPAILLREIFLRNGVFARNGWLGICVISFCLGFSAFYELIEWAAALISAEAAESFLGTQGDHWDTQWDMFLAGVGSLAALLFLSRPHNRSMRKISS
jgi:putative membrane protein